jgi:hypothetical protein
MEFWFLPFQATVSRASIPGNPFQTICPLQPVRATTVLIFQTNHHVFENNSIIAHSYRAGPYYQFVQNPTQSNAEVPYNYLAAPLLDLETTPGYPLLQGLDVNQFWVQCNNAPFRLSLYNICQDRFNTKLLVTRQQDHFNPVRTVFDLIWAVPKTLVDFVSAVTNPTNLEFRVHVGLGCQASPSPGFTFFGRGNLSVPYNNFVNTNKRNLP